MFKDYVKNKYSLNDDEYELLENLSGDIMKCNTVKLLLNVSTVKSLTKALTGMGYDANLKGCKELLGDDCPDKDIVIEVLRMIY